MPKPEKPKDRPLLEAALANIEVAVDLMTDSQAVAAIPVIGTAFKVCRGIDDLRSRAFATKLAKFISDPSLQPEKVKEKLKQWTAAAPEDAQRIGETLFLVLEKMADLEKPPLLAKVFSAYLDQVISSADLRRLAHAIDAAFADDLVKLLDTDEMHVSLGTDWKQPLAVSGLTRVTTGQTYDELGSVYYEVTELGHLLKKAVEHSLK